MSKEGHIMECMPFLVHGTNVETPEAVLESLASRALGGPFTVEDYTKDLQARSELATGQRLASSAAPDVVEFLVHAGIVQIVPA